MPLAYSVCGLVANVWVSEPEHLERQEADRECGTEEREIKRETVLQTMVSHARMQRLCDLHDMLFTKFAEIPPSTAPPGGGKQAHLHVGIGRRGLLLK